MTNVEPRRRNIVGGDPKRNREEAKAKGER